MPNLWGVSQVDRDGEGRSYVAQTVSSSGPGQQHFGRGEILSADVMSTSARGQAGRGVGALAGHTCAQVGRAIRMQGRGGWARGRTGPMRGRLITCIYNLNSYLN